MSEEKKKFLEICGEIFDDCEKAKKLKCTCFTYPDATCKYCHFMGRADDRWVNLADKYQINK